MLVCPVSGIGKKELGDGQNKKFSSASRQNKKREKNGPDPLPLHAHPLWHLSPFLLQPLLIIHPFLKEQPFAFLTGLVVPRSMLTYFEKEIRGVFLSSTKQPAKTLSRIACSLLEIGNVVVSFRAINYSVLVVWHLVIITGPIMCDDSMFVHNKPRYHLNFLGICTQSQAVLAHDNEYKR